MEEAIEEDYSRTGSPRPRSPTQASSTSPFQPNEPITPPKDDSLQTIQTAINTSLITSSDAGEFLESLYAILKVNSPPPVYQAPLHGDNNQDETLEEEPLNQTDISNMEEYDTSSYDSQPEPEPKKQRQEDIENEKDKEKEEDTEECKTEENEPDKRPTYLPTKIIYPKKLAKDDEWLPLADVQFPSPDRHTWYEMTTIFRSKIPMLYKMDPTKEDSLGPFHGGTLFIRKHQDTQATYCALQLSDNSLAMIHTFNPKSFYPWITVQADDKQYVLWNAVEHNKKGETQFSCHFPTLQESKKFMRAIQDASQYSSVTDAATISELIRDHKLYYL